MSLNQIDFFKGLSKFIKNEWIFNMKQRTLEAQSYLYQLDTNSEEMFVLNSGLVEIYHSFDKGKGEFVIEKLYRGSIINHNSFLMNDGIDTNAMCRNTVSIYYIHVNTINTMR